jgi:hypothetical protein
MPSSARRTPAFCKLSLYVRISAIESRLGVVPASTAWYPSGIINIINRIGEPFEHRFSVSLYGYVERRRAESTRLADD